MIMHTIDSISTVRLDLPLRDVFETSRRRALSSPTVFVKVLASGVIGWGEATPLEYVTGETQDSVIQAVARAQQALKGKPAQAYRVCSSRLQDAIPDSPSARAGVEMAILDAASKAAGMPLYLYLGGRPITVETDVTIPMVEPKQAADLAYRMSKQGFGMFKVKIGGTEREQDFERVIAVAEAVRGAVFLLDANEAFQPDEAVSFVNDLLARNVKVELLEQPVPRDDLESLKYVTDHSPVPVYADEAVQSPEDAIKLARLEAVSGIVVKTMKSGVIGAMIISGISQAAGLGLMLGAMLESRIGQTASLHLAAAVGRFAKFDLDSDMLLADQPVSSGFSRSESLITLTQEPGLGVRVELP